jgi:spindle assembly abnormal protein 6
VVALKADNGELRAKLEESRQQLQSNEQMIRWLNQQVTDAQLQVGAVPGSRFKFRPSQLTGTAAGGGTAAAATPSLSAGGYGGPRAASPGGLGAYSSGSKLTASVGTKYAPHASMSFGAYSPQTVTPKQDYGLPPAAVAAGTSRRI